MPTFKGQMKVKIKKNNNNVFEFNRQKLSLALKVFDKRQMYHYCSGITTASRRTVLQPDS